MLSFFTDTSTRGRKITLTIITALLWLLMIILGALAVNAANIIIRLLYLYNVAGGIESKTQASGLFRLLQMLTFFVGGLTLLILTIGGTYVFSHIGEARTIKFLGWTILIEVLLIVVSLVI